MSFISGIPWDGPEAGQGVGLLMETEEKTEVRIGREARRETGRMIIIPQEEQPISSVMGIARDMVVIVNTTLQESSGCLIGARMIIEGTGMKEGKPEGRKEKSQNDRDHGRDHERKKEQTKTSSSKKVTRSRSPAMGNSKERSWSKSGAEASNSSTYNSNKKQERRQKEESSSTKFVSRRMRDSSDSSESESSDDERPGLPRAYATASNSDSDRSAIIEESHSDSDSDSSQSSNSSGSPVEKIPKSICSV